MLRYIDTHCNLPNIIEKLKLPQGTSSFLQWRKENLSDHFEGCISVASDSASQPQTIELINNVNDIYAAFGIHPLYAGRNPIKSVLAFFIHLQ